MLTGRRPPAPRRGSVGSMRMTFDPPTDPDRYQFDHQVRVRFAETDAMAVVHHAAYLPYLEEARVEYLRALGHPYDDVRSQGIDFSVVEVAVRYLRPLRFGELVVVHVAMAWAKGATFQMDYLLDVDGEPRATAVTVHAVVDRDGRAVRTPAWLLDLRGGR
jgi:acyl-CoA thioester hydrolase